MYAGPGLLFGGAGPPPHPLTVMHFILNKGDKKAGLLVLPMKQLTSALRFTRRCRELAAAGELASVRCWGL